MAQISGEPDLRHASPAELALETVAILQSRLHAPGVEHGRDLAGRGDAPLYGHGVAASTRQWNRSRIGGVILGLH